MDLDIAAWSELVLIRLMALCPRGHKEETCELDDNSKYYYCGQLNNGSPKMSTFYSLEPVNVSYLAKGICQHDQAKALEMRVFWILL